MTESKKAWNGLVLGGVMAAAFAAGGGDGRGQDWPQYRGPERTGVSEETGLLSDWPQEGPRVVWRAPLGEGYSGVSVVGGKVYTMYGRDGGEFVACLDAGDGHELWTRRLDANHPSQQGGGPRSTPTVRGGMVYALGAAGKLAALRADSGQVVWHHDLRQELNARIPYWGLSGSPLVEGKLLLVQAGGRDGRSLVAFDKAGGQVVWTSQEDRAGYSSPVAATIHGTRQIVFFTGEALVAVAPDDGHLLWRQPWETSYHVNAAMPVLIPPDRVFVSSSYDVGAAVFRIDGEGGQASVHEVWRSRVMKNHFNSSILHQGYLYGFDSATLKCISAASGQEKWAQRGFGKGSLLLADGRLIILGERGQLALAEATPEGFRQKARVQILKGKTWTMPALSRGRLYLRDQAELVALDLAG
ncbi:MAG: PQQ-binding-like beta-propeller repeat protein [Acidobacteriota bacterium]